MLTIRFFRTGKKHQPFFKIVVTDKRKPPKSGRFVEEVGFYNPLTKEKNLKAERVKYWIAKGAQPSDTIHNLLISEKIVAGKKIALHKKAKKKEEKKEEKPTEVKPKEEEPKEEKPAEEKPKEDKPAEKKPAEKKPAEKKPAEEKEPEKEPSKEEGVDKKTKEE